MFSDSKAQQCSLASFIAFAIGANLPVIPKWELSMNNKSNDDAFVDADIPKGLVSIRGTGLAVIVLCALICMTFVCVFAINAMAQRSPQAVPTQLE